MGFPSTAPRRFLLRGLMLVTLLAAGAAGYHWMLLWKDNPVPPTVAPPAQTVAESDHLVAEIHSFCSDCHSYPPPDTFPRSAWKDEVERAYGFFGESGRPLQPPPIDAVVKYYEERAPLELPRLKHEPAPAPFGATFTQVGFAPLAPGAPAMSHVSLVRLHDPRRLDVLACEMRAGLVMTLRPYEAEPRWRVIGKVPNPARAEVVDLDRDGIPDVLVAGLGNFLPTDRRTGSVVWLRGDKNGGYTPFTVLEGVGRVADVQAADFNGDGKLDLVVAVFGWQHTGEIIWLENQTTDPAKPHFEPHIIDYRHGTIHVRVTDLNGDGKPDFIALISQEHETVVAFLNEGAGKFRPVTLYRAPHPGYGSSGIQLVDLDGDGDLDVLYTNGDVLDQPYLFKPYHSVQWLENCGNLTFKHRPLLGMYGVHRAVAADVDGDGDKDILAVSFLPAGAFPKRGEVNAAAVILLEQTAPGRFVPHTLESVSCDHVSCALGDVFGTGRVDLVVGNYTAAPMEHALTVWRNQGGSLSRKR